MYRTEKNRTEAWVLSQKRLKDWALQNQGTVPTLPSTNQINDLMYKPRFSMLHRSIERDMKTVSSALEYSYKVNKEANAQAMEQSTAASPNTSANQ